MQKIKISSDILQTCSVYQDNEYLGQVTYLQLLDIRVQCRMHEITDVSIKYFDNEGELVESTIDKDGRIHNYQENNWEVITEKLIKLF